MQTLEEIPTFEDTLNTLSHNRSIFLLGCGIDSGYSVPFRYVCLLEPLLDHLKKHGTSGNSKVHLSIPAQDITRINNIKNSTAALVTAKRTKDYLEAFVRSFFPELSGQVKITVYDQTVLTSEVKSKCNDIMNENPSGIQAIQKKYGIGKTSDQVREYCALNIACYLGLHDRTIIKDGRIIPIGGAKESLFYKLLPGAIQENDTNITVTPRVYESMGSKPVYYDSGGDSQEGELKLMLEGAHGFGEFIQGELKRYPDIRRIQKSGIDLNRLAQIYFETVVGSKHPY